MSSNNAATGEGKPFLRSQTRAMQQPSIENEKRDNSSDGESRDDEISREIGAEGSSRDAEPSRASIDDDVAHENDTSSTTESSVDGENLQQTGVEEDQEGNEKEQDLSEATESAIRAARERVEAQDSSLTLSRTDDAQMSSPIIRSTVEQIGAAYSAVASEQRASAAAQMEAAYEDGYANGEAEARQVAEVELAQQLQALSEAHEKQHDEEVLQMRHELNEQLERTQMLHADVKQKLLDEHERKMQTFRDVAHLERKQHDEAVQELQEELAVLQAAEMPDGVTDIIKAWSELREEARGLREELQEARLQHQKNIRELYEREQARVDTVTATLQANHDRAILEMADKLQQSCVDQRRQQEQVRSLRVQLEEAHRAVTAAAETDSLGLFSSVAGRRHLSHPSAHAVDVDDEADDMVVAGIADRMAGATRGTEPAVMLPELTDADYGWCSPVQPTRPARTPAAPVGSTASTSAGVMAAAGMSPEDVRLLQEVLQPMITAAIGSGAGGGSGGHSTDPWELHRLRTGRQPAHAIIENATNTAVRCLEETRGLDYLSGNGQLYLWRWRSTSPYNPRADDLDYTRYRNGHRFPEVLDSWRSGHVPAKRIALANGLTRHLKTYTGIAKAYQDCLDRVGTELRKITSALSTSYTFAQGLQALRKIDESLRASSLHGVDVHRMFAVHAEVILRHHQQSENYHIPTMLARYGTQYCSDLQNPYTQARTKVETPDAYAVVMAILCLPGQIKMETATTRLATVTPRRRDVAVFVREFEEKYIQVQLHCNWKIPLEVSRLMFFRQLLQTEAVDAEPWCRDWIASTNRTLRLWGLHENTSEPSPKEQLGLLRLMRMIFAWVGSNPNDVLFARVYVNNQLQRGNTSKGGRRQNNAVKESTDSASGTASGAGASSNAAGASSTAKSGTRAPTATATSTGQQGTSRASVTCYNCGKTGHISRNCQGPVQCRKCDGHGHIARDCPAENTDESKANVRRVHRSAPATTRATASRGRMPAPVDESVSLEKLRRTHVQQGAEIRAQARTHLVGDNRAWLMIRCYAMPPGCHAGADASVAATPPVGAGAEVLHTYYLYDPGSQITLVPLSLVKEYLPNMELHEVDEEITSPLGDGLRAGQCWKARACLAFTPTDVYSMDIYVLENASHAILGYDLLRTARLVPNHGHTALTSENGMRAALYHFNGFADYGAVLRAPVAAAAARRGGDCRVQDDNPGLSAVRGTGTAELVVTVGATTIAPNSTVWLPCVVTGNVGSSYSLAAAHVDSNANLLFHGSEMPVAVGPHTIEVTNTSEIAQRVDVGAIATTALDADEVDARVHDADIEGLGDGMVPSQWVWDTAGEVVQHDRVSEVAATVSNQRRGRQNRIAALARTPLMVQLEDGVTLEWETTRPASIAVGSVEVAEAKEDAEEMIESEDEFSALVMQVQLGHLSMSERRRVRLLLQKYQSVLSEGGWIPVAGESKEVDLQVKPEADLAKASQHRPISQAKRPLLHDLVRQWLRTGVCEPCESLVVESPLLLVTKEVERPGGIIETKNRLVLDLKGTNRVLQPMQHQLPRLDELAEKLSRYALRSVVDISNAFYALKLSDASKPYVGFCLDSNLYMDDKNYGRCFSMARLAQGCSISPRLWTAYSEKLLDIPDTTVYMDDVGVGTGKWSLRQARAEEFSAHLARLEEVFARLQAVNLKVAPKKLEICKEEVRYLGLTVGRGCYQPLDSSLQSFQNLPQPVCGQDVKRMIGLGSWLRSHIPRFAEYVQPFHALSGVKRRSEFAQLWTQEHTEAFERLKTAVAGVQPLFAQSEGTQLQLETDASDTTIAGSLWQIWPDGTKQLLRCCSRKLQDAETRYAVCEKELLGVVHCAHRFRWLIHGSHTRVTLRSDHKSIQYMLQGPMDNKSARLCRWLIYLGGFAFTFQFAHGGDATSSSSNLFADVQTRGASHARGGDGDEANDGKLADEDVLEFMQERVPVMSTTTLNAKELDARPKWMVDGKDLQSTYPSGELHRAGELQIAAGQIVEPEEKENEDDDQSRGGWSIMEEDTRLLLRILRRVPEELQLDRERIIEEQKDMPGYQKCLDTANDEEIDWFAREYVQVQGLLYRRSFRRREYMIPALMLVLPERYRQAALYMAHNLNNHCGALTVYWSLREKVHWPGMRENCRIYVAECVDCCTRRKISKAPRGPDGKLPCVMPGELLVLDFWGPIHKSTSGMQYVLSVCDAASCFTFWLPMAEATAAATAQALVTHVLPITGCVRKIQADAGSVFTSNLLQELLRRWGSKPYISDIERPQAQSRVERQHGTLARAIAALEHEQKENWDSCLGYFALMENNRVRQSLGGYSPSQVFLGRRCNTPLDVWALSPPPEAFDHLAEAAGTRSFPKLSAEDIRLLNEHEDRAELCRLLSLDCLSDEYDEWARTTRRQTYFKVGDIVWLQSKSVAASSPAPKVSCMFRGPYMVERIEGSSIILCDRYGSQLSAAYHRVVRARAHYDPSLWRCAGERGTAILDEIETRVRQQQSPEGAECIRELQLAHENDDSTVIDRTSAVLDQPVQRLAVSRDAAAAWVPDPWSVEITTEDGRSITMGEHDVARIVDRRPEEREFGGISDEFLVVFHAPPGDVDRYWLRREQIQDHPQFEQLGTEYALLVRAAQHQRMVPEIRFGAPRKKYAGRRLHVSTEARQAGPVAEGRRKRVRRGGQRRRRRSQLEILAEDPYREIDQLE